MGTGTAFVPEYFFVPELPSEAEDGTAEDAVLEREASGAAA